MDPNYVRSLLKDAGIVKGINRPAALAHVWAHDRNVLTSISKLISSAYVLSEIKADKKGNAFKLKIVEAK